MREHPSHEVRHTSIESYAAQLRKLGEHQMIVLAAILMMNDRGVNPTDREITRELAAADPNFVRPRRFELMKQEVIVEGDSRQCSVSKRKAIPWRVNPMLLALVRTEVKAWNDRRFADERAVKEREDRLDENGDFKLQGSGLQ